jgi:hypothetical protein
MQENPKRWDLTTLSRPNLPGANANHLPAISSRSSRLIAALGIAEVTLQRASPVVAESPLSNVAFDSASEELSHHRSRAGARHRAARQLIELGVRDRKNLSILLGLNSLFSRANSLFFQ